MRGFFPASCALALLVSGAVGSAQTFDEPPLGKEAGKFMLRARAVGVIPENNSSSTSIRGRVDASAQAAPELDISYFFTENVAAELIAATTRHSVQVKGTALGDLDVASTWILPPTLTLQYHFMPRSRFSPYFGAGINVSLFYDTSARGPVAQSVSLDSAVGGALQIGFDYNVSGHWFANFDVKQIFLGTTAHIRTPLGPVTAKTDLDPLVIGVGIGYRF